MARLKNKEEGTNGSWLQFYKETQDRIFNNSSSKILQKTLFSYLGVASEN